MSYREEMIIGLGGRILVMGSTGFIGARVIDCVLAHGCRNGCGSLVDCVACAFP